MTSLSPLFITKLLISILLVSLLLYWMDWKQARDIILEVEVTWIALCLLLIILVTLMDGLRLYLMLPIHNMHFSEHLRISLQSAFVMQLGFGVISGETYRISAYALKSGAILKPAVYIIAARVAGILSISLITLLIFLYVLYVDSGSNQPLIKRSFKFVVILCCTITLLYYLFIKRKKTHLPNWLNTTLEAIKSITLKVWILSIIIVLTRGFSFACILYSTSHTTPLHVPFLASIFASISSFLPIALGGLGLREGALVGTATLFHVPYIIAMTAAITMRFTMILACSVGLIISFTLPNNIDK